jgi:hypothetical protein
MVLFLVRVVPSSFSRLVERGVAVCGGVVVIIVLVTVFLLVPL